MAESFPSKAGRGHVKKLRNGLRLNNMKESLPAAQLARSHSLNGPCTNCLWHRGPLPTAIELTFLGLQLLRRAPAGFAGCWHCATARDDALSSERGCVVLDQPQHSRIARCSRSLFDAQFLSMRCGWSRTTQPRSED